MKKLLLAIVAAVVLSIPHNADALTCYAVDWPVPNCTDLGPTAPPGFTWCGNDRNAYTGEIVIFTDVNYGGYCFYAHPNMDLVVSDLGELRSQWHVRSYKSKLTRVGMPAAKLHSLTNLGGQECPIWGVSSNPNFTQFVPASLQGHN